jgi:hypothetical protein
MTIVAPLKITAEGDLQQMNDVEIAQIKTRMFWLFVGNPIARLSVVSGYASDFPGSLGALYDTRLQAGTASDQLHAFAPTGHISTVTVSIANLLQTIGTQALPNTSAKDFPLYYGPDGNIKVMSLQDMYDTFCYDVFDGGYVTADESTLGEGLSAASSIYTVAGTDQETPNALDGYTAVSTTPIFTDTRANLDLYTAAGIPETRDQPKTIQNYFLYKRNVVNTSYTIPATINSFGDLQPPSASTMDALLLSAIRYLVSQNNGYGLNYAYNGTGATCGTIMTDTRLNGTGNYQTLTLGSEYRAQEFPDGSPIVQSYYKLTQQIV